MKFFPRFSMCAATLLALVLASPLRAGQITGFSWFSGVASVAGTSFSAPSAPNNDDMVGTSPNEIFVTQKDYVGIGPVDLVFDVTDTGGVTEYLVREGVQNGTGVDWSGYHLELGFGNGAGFTKSTSGDGLDFDSPDFNSLVDFNPSPGFFPSVTVTEDDIIAGGGIQPDFSFAGYYRFHIDVPDGITEFTIRQSPLPLVAGPTGMIPEPSSFMLAALGLLSCTIRRKQKRQ